MKLTTAGESHGKGLVGILENVPAGLALSKSEVDAELAFRQSGYGRGARQAIEKDKVEFLSGVRNGRTLGSPVAFFVENRDYENWKRYMGTENADVAERRLTRVRPGHADLSGMLKYGHDDARNVLERASARETAARVAGGSVCKQFLASFGIAIAGYCVSIGSVHDDGTYSFEEIAKNARKAGLFMMDKGAEERAEAEVDRLKAAGDTAGGVIEIRVKGLKSGFGSCMEYAKKLDARLAAAAMSVQAIKGVEFGLGFAAAKLPGSAVHDEIFFDGGYRRETNRAGGIEGGMSNGEEIVLRAAMKPIPTLMKGLRTVDTVGNTPAVAAAERSDVTAVPACTVVLEAALAVELSEVVAERLGGDRMEEMIARWQAL